MDSDIIGLLFIIINLINLILLVPIVYPIVRITMGWCQCAFDIDFIIIILYLIITLSIIIGSILTRLEILDINNRTSRVIIVAYFLLTFVFVEAGARYVKKTRENCLCLKEDYKKMLTSLTVIRWLGVYLFGLVLISAGLYLFIRSNQRPFSFPATKRRSYNRSSFV